MTRLLVGLLALLAIGLGTGEDGAAAPKASAAMTAAHRMTAIIRAGRIALRERIGGAEEQQRNQEAHGGVNPIMAHR